MGNVNADVLALALTTKDVLRFWSKVDIRGPDEYWEWQASVNIWGHGQFWLNGTQLRSHRVAYFLIYGNIPDGLCVCHTCDKPSCCNPHHLFTGTQQDNTRDRCLKGRSAKGESGGNHKLTIGQVNNIRERYAQGDITQQALANLFGVAHSTISAVVTRLTWKSV
jgi:hypothetical protein